MAIRVNGELVPEAAVRVELLRLVLFCREHMPGEDIEGQKDVLLERAKQQAIGAKLLLDEARRREIPVEEKEIDARIRKLIRDLGGEGNFRDALKRQRLSEAGLRSSLADGIRVDKLVAQITSELPEPTDEEALRYFQRHEGEFLTAERVKVRHILAKPDSDDAKDRASAKAKLTALKGTIEDGSDFAALAAAWSDCSSGKESGGLIGWIARGTALPAVEEAVFNQEVGGVSDVIETPMGYHIFQTVEREEGHAASFEEVKVKILDLMRHSRRGHALSKFVSQLRQKAAVEDDGDNSILADFERMRDRMGDGA